MSNLWERQQNKRARAKKDRAIFKLRHNAETQTTSEEWITETPPDQTVTGILASVQRNSLRVMVDTHIIDAFIDPSLFKKHACDFVVGDRIWIKQNNAHITTIVGRSPRVSSIRRTRGDDTRHSKSENHVLAANIDVGVITVALKNPDLQPAFIDRYLVLLQDGNVSPLLCLTKTDLSPERPSILEAYRQIGVPIVETSSREQRGIDELKKHLSNKVAVFIGQSGVGKSSLLNAIAPSLEIATNTVSEKTGEGRHTTTQSNVYRWDEGSYIIDTPGIRSLRVDQIPKEELRFLFPEFSELATHCAYHDCLHLQEPDCAVIRSLHSDVKIIDESRYESYVRMMKA